MGQEVKTPEQTEAAFDPTLTLHHPASGWDGTHEEMLSVMAEVLHDGPVEAELTYWNGREYITVTGKWVSHTVGENVVFAVTTGVSLHVDHDQIQTLSI